MKIIDNPTNIVIMGEKKAGLSWFQKRLRRQGEEAMRINKSFEKHGFVWG